MLLELKNGPNLGELYADFVSLVFPNYCISCHDSLNRNENHICTTCRFTMPITNYHLHKENSLAQRFWGRIHLNHAFAYLKYIKYGRVQKIIHHLKYKGLEEVGEMMGNWYAAELRKEGFHDHFDLILPVPLHHSRLKTRGYNQSDSFAKGMAEVLELPWSATTLTRNVASTTQTKKKRFDRWNNVKDIFSVRQPDHVEGKRILLVDDVITTGATIEACATQLLESKCSHVSVAAIATAY